VCGVYDGGSDTPAQDQIAAFTPTDQKRRV
jgi:hypothetical protein